ncbi:MAG: hypothetical protein ACJ768_15740 [Gaiellaceae bacterium]
MTLVGGRWIAHHWLPSHDHLTVAGAGRRWVDEQWLAQWVMYELWNVGGYALLAAAAAALIASAFGILVLILLERGAQPARAVKWATLAFAVSLPDVAVRAQDFAYPLFALLCGLLLREPALRRRITVIALLVLWANLHGSVLVGALLAAAAFARRPRQVLWAAAALASPLATPYGLGVVHYYDSVLGNSSLQRFASEWKPATATPIAAFGFFLLVLALAYVVVVGWRRGVRPPLSLAIATLALVAAGFAELRWETWAAFAGAIFATDMLNVYDPTPPRPAGRGLRLVAIAATVATAAGVAVLATKPASRFEDTLPAPAMAAATQYLHGHPQARVLADDDTADGLLWKEPPLAGRVAFDDRLEIYPARDVDRWADWITGKPSALGLSKGYDVLVGAASNAALVRRIRSTAGWHVIYAGAAGAAAARTR